MSTNQILQNTIDSIESFALETQTSTPENVREIDGSFVQIDSRYKLIDLDTFATNGSINGTSLPFSGYIGGLAIGQEVPESVNGLNWLNYTSFNGSIGIIEDSYASIEPSFTEIATNPPETIDFEDQVISYETPELYNEVTGESYGSFYYINQTTGEISESPIYYNTIVGFSSSSKLYYDKFTDTMFESADFDRHFSYLHTTFYKTQIVAFSKKESVNPITGENLVDPKFVNTVTGEQSDFPIYYNKIAKESFSFPVYIETYTGKKFIDFAFIQANRFEQIKLNDPSAPIGISILRDNTYFDPETFRFWNAVRNYTKTITQTDTSLWKIAKEVNEEQEALENKQAELLEVYNSFKTREEGVRSIKLWDKFLTNPTLGDPRNYRDIRFNRIENNDYLFAKDGLFKASESDIVNLSGEINPTQEQIIAIIKNLSFKDNLSAFFTIDVVPSLIYPMVSIPRVEDFDDEYLIDVLDAGEVGKSVGGFFSDYYYIYTPRRWEVGYVKQLIKEKSYFLNKEVRFTDELDIELLKLLRVETYRGQLPLPRSKSFKEDRFK